MSQKKSPWYEAYMAALFEADPQKVGKRIKQAEALILKRERELFSGREDLSEQHALNSKLHDLRALRACLQVDSIEKRSSEASFEAAA